MQFSCTQENFRAALALTGHIAARQGSLPILSNVLIRAEHRALTLMTTNLELAMTFHLRGKVETDGVFTANAKLLSDVVTLLPHDRVDATVRGGTLELTCGGNVTKVRGMDATEFPLIPTVAERTDVRVRADLLRAALGQVVFALATTESRPELSGSFWQCEGIILTIAGTDSYRLAEAKVSLLANGTPKGTSFIVPGRTLQELVRILAQVADDADITEVIFTPTSSQLLVTIGNLELISRLVDGTYPDYRQILPRGASTTLTMPRAELQTAVRAAGLFAKTGVNDVHLRILPAQRQCIVRSENAQLGEHQAVLDAECSGDEATVILNARYLLEGLAATPGERVVLAVSGATAPVLLRALDGVPNESGTAEYLYVIMPIKQ